MCPADEHEIDKLIANLCAEKDGESDFVAFTCRNISECFLNSATLEGKVNIVSTMAAFAARAGEVLDNPFLGDGDKLKMLGADHYGILDMLPKMYPGVVSTTAVENAKKNLVLNLSSMLHRCPN